MGLIVASPPPGYRNHPFDPFTVLQATFSANGRLFATASRDGRVTLWDLDRVAQVATLVSFADGTWAVSDEAGRFDGADGGRVAGLHWVVDDTPIALDQLRERFYAPGLLARALGHDPTPLQDVDLRGSVPLPPRAVAAIDSDGRLTARFQDMGGGLGDVDLLINGRPVPTATRAAAELSLDLKEQPALIPGEDNVIRVSARNADGWLHGRAVTLHYRPPVVQAPDPPELWAVIIGVSDYAGEDLDLRFAAKDAADMAEAIRLAAGGLFGEAQVHVQLLRTGGAVEPTRAAIASAFAEARQARPQDVFVAYFAGHGVTWGGADGDFHFLTRDATTARPSDPKAQEHMAVSSDMLAEWMRTVPANKQVLLLDTCASGQLIDDLFAARDVDVGRARALHRLRDRAGLYVLAGSAADAVSYEASRYGQGLLTWSLLSGMRWDALRDGEFLDVSRWLGHAADTVPGLARHLGGVQRPLVAVPRGAASFDIGRLGPEERQAVPVAAPQPLILRTSLQDEVRFTDHLGLAGIIDRTLRRHAGDRAVFVQGAGLPDGRQVVGRYTVEGERLRLQFVVAGGADGSETQELEGAVGDLEAVATQVAERVLEGIPDE